MRRKEFLTLVAGFLSGCASLSGNRIRAKNVETTVENRTCENGVENDATVTFRKERGKIALSGKIVAQSETSELNPSVFTTKNETEDFVILRITTNAETELTREESKCTPVLDYRITIRFNRIPSAIDVYHGISGRDSDERVTHA